MAPGGGPGSFVDAWSDHNSRYHTTLRAQNSNSVANIDVKYACTVQASARRVATWRDEM